MKTKTTHTDRKYMKRTHTNWSDNSKHSLWLIRRKKLEIVVSLGELFLFSAKHLDQRRQGQKENQDKTLQNACKVSSDI